MKRPCVGLALVSLEIVLGCGSARRSEPLRGPLSLDPAQSRGQVAFFHRCNKCHPQGDAGVGPALNNKPLPDGAIRLQVRDGLGAMPSFSRQELPDTELEDVLRYLHVLRNH